MRQAATKLQQLDQIIGAADREAQLLNALSEPDLLVRRRAIALSARFLGPATLVSVLRDGTHAARRSAALSALKRQVPYCFEELRKACHDPDPDVAISAMELLSVAGDHEARPLFESMTDHGDTNVAAAAVEALGQLRDPRAVGVLTRALGRGAWQRMAAIAALGELRDRCAVPALVSTLADPDVCELAVAALGTLGDSASIAALVQFAEGVQRPSTFSKVVHALGRIVAANKLLDGASKAALHRLCNQRRALQIEQLLRSGECQVAQASARLLLVAGAGDENVEQVLARASREPAHWTEVLLLYQGNVERGLPMLLNHNSIDVRIQALQVAGNGHGALHVVLRCAEHEDVRVRAAACSLLGRTGSVQAAGMLVLRLTRGAEMEREAALGALTALGPAAHSSIIAALSAEQDTVVRAALLLALARAGRVEHPALTSRIVEWTHKGPPLLRRAALTACASQTSVAAREALVNGLDDSDASVASEAARQLALAGKIAPIVERLGRVHPARSGFLLALGRPNAGLAVQPLIQLYSEANELERINIIGALSRIGSAEAIRFVMSKLRDPEAAIRRIAAESACALTLKPELSLLEELARDSDWLVRKCAVTGLSRIEPTRARALLMELSRDTDDMVSEAARTALLSSRGMRS